ncbi:MAG: monooxygenase [Acidimicrobiales bacterium mtb01]|nr:nitronate monooxygenase [Actinomycetota bacterium]TEX45677.1 MAG: monooxygenase [Acidimicrobiales bacterium mtb01]
MRTQVTDMFEIDVPIMAFSHCRDVVVAVTKAGGLGVLGAAAHSRRQLEIDLAWIDDQLAGRPYGIDLIVPMRYDGDSKGGATVGELLARIPDGHHRFVSELLDRFGVPPLDPAPEQAALNLDSPMAASSRAAGALLDIALDHRPVLVVNALGPPPEWMIERAKAVGARVGALAGKAEHAARHVAAGVDVLIAQGSEAGGHTGEIGSMVLIPEIVDAAGDVPVLGAGGIGRGRQMAAAMALGASGVWCGSVWLTTHEAETHPTVKKKMLEASSSDTVRSKSRTGKYSRQLRSAWTDAWAAPDAPEPLPMPLQPLLVDQALKAIDRAAHQPGSGAEALANYWVGQVVGSMNLAKPAAQVVFEMVDEFVDAVSGLSRLLDE